MKMDSSNNIFWGLVVRPGKRYETEVQEPFRITKACLEPASKANEVSSLYVEYDDNEEFIIANLNANNLNVTTNLSFNKGEKICFKVDGPGTVHLTGNLLDDHPTSDMYGMEDRENIKMNDFVDTPNHAIEDYPVLLELQEHKNDFEHANKLKDDEMVSSYSEDAEIEMVDEMANVVNHIQSRQPVFWKIPKQRTFNQNTVRRDRDSSEIGMIKNYENMLANDDFVRNITENQDKLDTFTLSAWYAQPLNWKPSKLGERWNATVAQLCQFYQLKDYPFKPEWTFTEYDKETYEPKPWPWSKFNDFVTPLLEFKNPDTSPSKLFKLKKAKWFDVLNPHIPEELRVPLETLEGDEEEDDDYEDM